MMASIRPVQNLLFLGVAALFVLSSNLLYVLGINYAVADASALIKIHPSSYLFFIVVMISPIVATPVRQKALSRQGFVMIAVSIGSLISYQLLSTETGGGESSLLLVTYCASGALAVTLSYAEERTLERINRFVSLFLICNSVVGIAEALGAPRLLPYVIGDTIIDFDSRPTALLGHPLNNALVTGAWCLALLLSNYQARLNLTTSILLLLHIIALLAFGGRAALVAAILGYILFVVHQAVSKLFDGDSRDVIRLLKFAVVASALTPVLVYTGAADTIIERFLDSRGSDETRSAALVMLNLLSPSQWLSGVPLSARTTIQALLGSTRGIEISWIALIYSFGLPIAAALLTATFFVLKSAFFGSAYGMRTMLFYFFSATFLSLSIGSKSLLVSQTMVILVCYAERTKKRANLCLSNPEAVVEHQQPQPIA